MPNGPKMKTHKGTKKRFDMTGTGQLRHAKGMKSHFRRRKASRVKRAFDRMIVLAPADLRTMRNHFRKLLTVYDPNGKPLLFRYYDPRVLRVYLPTCNAEELATIFGPINSYLLEDEV